MSHVGLSRARHLILVTRFLERAGTAIEPLAERVHLPIECLSRPEMLVPTHCIREFREEAARSLGLPNIILEATRNLSFEQLGHFGQSLARTQSLYQSLVEFCTLANTESSSVVVMLKQGNDCVWLTHRPLEKQDDQWNSELYILRMMLWTVRLSAPHWSPEYVDICFTPTPERKAALDELGCERAMFGAKFTSIPIPKSMLALPLQVTRPKVNSTLLERGQYLATAPATTFSKSLSQVLHAYRLKPWTQIEITAEVAGFSVRTLQRRLSDEGLTFSSFVQRSRFDHAIALLTTTDATIADIAGELGYTTQANFTRAFGRWAGVSPAEFRRQRRSV